MSQKEGLLDNRSAGELYRITRERLKGTNADLIAFHFRQGGNIYVFSYEKGGKRRHTVVDAGDARCRNQLMSNLAENDVDLANIERIVITHGHPDHCGLAAALAKESKARILAHANFRSFVEGQFSERERWMFSSFNLPELLSGLKECDIEYLLPSGREVIDIGGVGFPSLVEPVEIGEVGRLLILACPESTLTHTSDQVIVLYSPRTYPRTSEGKHDHFRPTDDIFFSGDLWLMTGPVFDRRMLSRRLKFRLAFNRVKYLMSGGSMPYGAVSEQDAKAKDALKRGFSLVRVKPAHGEEFMGSRIIPNSLLADRDLLMILGYSMNADKSILRQTDLAPKIAAIREDAYTGFVQELLCWKELGYTSSEISELLLRIYKEQSGGGVSLVVKDRKQRREKLKATLARLRNDQAASDGLHQLADSTLLELRRVS